MSSYRIFAKRIYLENIMRRARLLVFLVIAFAPFAALAQFSNSWINFSQPYFKIPVSKDGIYRLTYADLQAAGLQVGAIDPRTIQLYHRGKEQAIYVRGQGDGKFGPNEYIEFFGQRNDGTLDSSLYMPSSLQPHKYYNLYSDTTAYFLTVNSSFTRGLRMDSAQNANSGFPA